MIRDLNLFLAGETHVAVAQVVGEDENDVGRADGCRAGPAARRSRQPNRMRVGMGSEILSKILIVGATPGGVPLAPTMNYLNALKCRAIVAMLRSGSPMLRG